jgi:hypothetical protein
MLKGTQPCLQMCFFQTIEVLLVKTIKLELRMVNFIHGEYW